MHDLHFIGIEEVGIGFWGVSENWWMEHHQYLNASSSKVVDHTLLVRLFSASMASTFCVSA